MKFHFPRTWHTSLNIAIFFVVVGIYPQISYSAELHVGSGRSFSTISSAISASSSGDKVVIHEGTYREYYLQPKSSTTLISAKQTGNFPSESMPIIDGGATAYQSNDSHDVIIFYPGKTNVTIDGLEIRNGGRDNIMLPDSSSSGITIQNCVLKIDSWSSYAGDNSGNIHIMNGNSGIIIQNNVMYAKPAGVHGVLGFGCSGNILVKNNEIHISGNGGGGKDSHGIFWKHGGNNSLVIENNAIWVTGYSANNGIWAVNDNTYIDNNLIITTEGRYGVLIGGSMGVTGGTGSKIIHNTIYGGKAGIKSEDGYNATNITFSDNIIFGYSEGEYSLYSLWLYGTTRPFTSDYNLIFGIDNTKIQYGSSALNFSQWQGQGFDTHGISATPNFSNSSGTLSKINDFTINSGNGNNSSSDERDMGADMSSVGATFQATVANVPSAPLALRENK